MSDTDPFADALAHAVSDAIWYAIAARIPHLFANANICADPDCDRGPHEHGHITPDLVARALAHADDDPTADTAY